MFPSQYITAAQQYKAGTRLTLWQYEPVQPHGLSEYTRNPLPDDLPPDHLRDFDLEMTRSTRKEDVDKQAVLQVSKVISGGDNNTVQVILFDVIQPPVSYRGDAARLPGDGTQVVGLLYDTEFYPSDEYTFCSNAEQADGNLSRTDAALKHFFSKNKTGHPHVVPQYYGCWATRVDTYDKNAFRYVGLVLEEYINGHSIEDICGRDEYDELVPPDGDVVFHMPKAVDDGFHTLEISKELCQEVMKQAVNGLVEHMHIGVQHNVFEPRKVFITLRNGKVGLDWPRAVLLGFTNTQVWSKTKMAKGPKGPVQLLEHLPHPPHPFQRFSVTGLENFIGWWPSPEVGWESDEPGDFDNEAEFDEWLVSDETFGPLVEAADVEAELGKGVEWPHPYKKYSLFKTLDPIKPKLLEEREERRRKLEEEELKKDSDANVQALADINLSTAQTKDDVSGDDDDADDTVTVTTVSKGTHNYPKPTSAAAHFLFILCAVSTASQTDPTPLTFITTLILPCVSRPAAINQLNLYQSRKVVLDPNFLAEPPEHNYNKMSTFRYISPTKQCHPGTKLELWPYKPAEPHGRSQYTRNPLPRDLHPGWMRNFDPTALNNRAEEAAVIEIDEMIHGGDSHLAQILACNLVDAPKHQRSPEELTQLTKGGKPVKVQIVAEIFDPEFYPGGTGAPYDNYEQADGNLSCADAALRHLFTKGLTGHPHFAPQYYGCWVARIQARQRSTGRVTERFVGVVLREHIIGHSIEALCHRDEYGQLLPFEGRVFFHDSDDAEEGQVCLELEKEVCQDILKQALHGIVCHLHVGVKHEMFEPKNIYLTMRDGNIDLEKPRAVLLGHMLAQVWSKTTEAQGPLELKQLLEHLAYPPHPRLRFGFRAVDDFVGWFPSPPNGWYGNEPATFDSKKEYEDWIISEEVFGPLVEAAEVEKGLEDGAEWPYPYGKYSLFKSLDAVKEDLLRQRQEKRRLAEQQLSPKDTQKGR